MITCIMGCFVCVLFTLSRSFYPSPSSTTSVRTDYSILSVFVLLDSFYRSTLLIPFIIFAHILLSLLPTRNSDPGSHSGRFYPLVDIQHNHRILQSWTVERYWQVTWSKNYSTKILLLYVCSAVSKVDNPTPCHHVLDVDG